MDALAITLAGGGTAVGVTPMGTALAVDQIKLLRPHIDLVNGRDRIAVATDSDPAGWTSAQKQFWQLTVADLDPSHLALSSGTDPAQLLESEGPEALGAALKSRATLGDAMIDHLLDSAGNWSDAATRQTIIHQAARILGARGAEHWPDAFERLRNRLHLAPGILEHQTVTESIDYDRNRAAYARARIHELTDQATDRTAGPARMPRTSHPEKDTLTETAPSIRPDQHKPGDAAPETKGPSR